MAPTLLFSLIIVAGIIFAGLLFLKGVPEDTQENKLIEKQEMESIYTGTQGNGQGWSYTPGNSNVQYADPEDFGP